MALILLMLTVTTAAAASPVYELLPFDLTDRWHRQSRASIKRTEKEETEMKIYSATAVVLLLASASVTALVLSRGVRTSAVASARQQAA